MIEARVKRAWFTDLPVAALAVAFATLASAGCGEETKQDAVNDVATQNAQVQGAPGPTPPSTPPSVTVAPAPAPSAPAATAPPSPTAPPPPAAVAPAPVAPVSSLDAGAPSRSSDAASCDQAKSKACVDAAVESLKLCLGAGRNPDFCYDERTRATVDCAVEAGCRAPAPEAPPTPSLCDREALRACFEQTAKDAKECAQAAVGAAACHARREAADLVCVERTGCGAPKADAGAPSNPPASCNRDQARVCSDAATEAVKTCLALKQRPATECHQQRERDNVRCLEQAGCR